MQHAPHHPPDQARCPLCGGTTFRRSRMTFLDVSKLMVFEIPIRCQDCGERASVPLPKAIKAIVSSYKHRSGINY